MRNVSTKWLAFGIVVVSLVLAGVVSYYASSSPDGLERVAHDKGFAETATEHGVADGPLADYAVKDVDHDRLSGGLAGVVGVVVVLALGAGLAYLVRHRGPVGPTDAREREPVV